MIINIQVDLSVAPESLNIKQLSDLLVRDIPLKQQVYDKHTKKYVVVTVNDIRARIANEQILS